MAVAAIGTTMDQAMTPRFVWNASASVPIGLYSVHPAHRLTVTALAVAYPPEPLAGWLAQRRYLPRGVPLLKPILALDGETVCRVGPLIMIDGREIGIVHEKDHSGRPLPFWQGCRLIGHSETGRYFGPLNLRVGHAKGAVDLELNGPTGLLVWTSSPSCCGLSRRARCFPFSGHNPTRGYARALWIVGRIERPPGRPAILRMAASLDPPIGG
jgi:type IV secretory pathway protease TraF